MIRYSSMGFFLAVLFAFMGFTTGGWAEERATRQECMEKVSQAIELVKKAGRQTTFNQLMEENGQFIWKDAHVFSINSETGVLLAHRNPGSIGFQMRDYLDANGGHPYADILDLLKTKNEGWLTYITDRMGWSVPKLKHMYYKKVPGEDLVFCSGYYPRIADNQVSVK